MEETKKDTAPKPWGKLVAIAAVILIVILLLLWRNALNGSKEDPTTNSTTASDQTPAAAEATKTPVTEETTKPEPSEQAAESTKESEVEPGDNAEGSSEAADTPTKAQDSTSETSEQTTAVAESSSAETKPEETKPAETEAPTEEFHPVAPGNSALNTGDLTAYTTTYEGTKGTGQFNYGEALQKSLLFYELQRSGRLPDEVRCNWRGDSGLTDGADVGLDLTGGWYDAGDHVKFNLPMAYTGAMLAWSLYEDYDAYVESGQLQYMLDNLRWVNDYLIKCHPEKNVYYYQVGSGSIDHGWWGPAEAMQMSRPSYKVDLQNPGSCVAGEAAASLAACSLVFQKIDPAYSALCLKHAKELYEFADITRSDAGYTAANGFYNSWSGFWDELGWSATWIYMASGDAAYLEKAKSAMTKASGDYDWAQCWDNVYFGACLLLAKLTGENTYIKEVETHLDTWTVGANGKKVQYTPKGLAYIDQWGSLRYATTTAFMAAVYSTSDICPEAKKSRYWDFAVSQVNYALGSTGRSYLIGFGENYPEHPHHRTAQGSWSDNMNDPSGHRHILFGALVGGPNQSDSYDDSVSNFQTNEVACDYNAGFTGALAKLYSVYKGQTLKNFGAVEKIEDDELSISASVNVRGNDFIEIRAFVYNKTGWPARVTDDLELRYFVDLSEIYAAGGNAGQLEITGNYMQGGKIGGLYVWDEEKHIYYVSIDFSGAIIRPGGQDAYKKEVQFRIRNANGVWDNTNDPSFADLTNNNGSAQVKAYHIALYDGDKLVFGGVPASGATAGTVVTRDPSNINNGNNGGNNGNNGNNGGSTGGGQVVTGDMVAQNKILRVENQTGAMQTSGNTLGMQLLITNAGDGYLKLSDLEIDYYFTKDAAPGLSFYCDYSAVQSSDGYSAVEGIRGEFVPASGKDADTVCRITNGLSSGIAPGGTWLVQVRVAKSDWSNFDLNNDYSTKDVQNIVIRYAGEIIFGTEPK